MTETTPLTWDSSRGPRHWITKPRDAVNNKTTEAQLLFALKNLIAVMEGGGGTAFPADLIAHAAIARAEGRPYPEVVPQYWVSST